MKILVVVEDDRERVLIVGALQKKGLCVDDAASTLAAIRFMDSTAYDLVLARRTFALDGPFLNLVRINRKDTVNVLLYGPSPCPGELFAERLAVTKLGTGFLPFNPDRPDVFTALVQNALVDPAFTRVA